MLVHHERPRIDWKLAVVERLIRSRDGHVRAADIRTASGKSNRPISRLVPLEITYRHEPRIGPKTKPKVVSTDVTQPSSRPGRQAKTAAKAAAQATSINRNSATESDS